MSTGNVIVVEERAFGSELAAAASAGASSITVEDTADFQPDGGDALVGDEEVSYDTVNETTGVLELDGTLASAWPAETVVAALPATVERFAHVVPEGDDEAMIARIPHALYDRLDVGIRDPATDELEVVELDRDTAGELVVTDVLGRVPQVQAGFNVGTFDGIVLPHGLNVDAAPEASRIVWVDEAGGKRAQIRAGDDFYGNATISVEAGDADAPPGENGARSLIVEDGSPGMYRGWSLHDALDWYAPDDGLKDWTIDPLVVGSDTFTMTSQRLAGVAFVPRRNLTITTIVVRCTGAGTSFNNWNGAAVYLWDDISGGSGTMGWLFLRDTGTTNNTLFNAAGERELNLTSPLGPITPGNLIYVALLGSWTGTAPVIHGVTTAHMVNTQRTDAYASAGISGRTSRPNVDFAHSALSTFTNVPWIGLK